MASKNWEKAETSIKRQDFHLIRPVCALGTFPSRGRLEIAFLFLEVWFFDSLRLFVIPYIFCQNRPC